MTPPLRIRVLGPAAARPGDYVLYWMTAFRRPGWNFALQRAAEEAARLGRPLLVFEALRAGYRWASDRLHAFALQGMADHAEAFAARGVSYLPYVEPEPGAGRGLLLALAERACLVVADDAPMFFLPRMLESAADALRAAGVRLEAVDSCGLLPLAAAPRPFARAVDFRRHLQKTLAPHLFELPEEDPLAAYAGGPAPLPPLRWAPASPALLRAEPAALAELPIDHAVPVAPLRGGFRTAGSLLDRFLDRRLDRYADGRNHPDDETASGLSAHLHWGHLSAHEVFVRVAEREGWDPGRLGERANGARHGWWGLSEAAEAFLDELVTWRELGWVHARHEPDPDRWEALPEWARRTLDEHADDPREALYDRATLEEARTGDPIWNAAQTQLLREGRMHNYLRMLWGKKVLQWTAHPRDALELLVELNNRWALDGRDPNSSSGIGWVLGRFDRAWGPERPVFGKVRCMTSDSTRRKLRLDDYLRRYGPRPQPALF